MFPPELKPAAREQRGELAASRSDGDNGDTRIMVLNEEMGWKNYARARAINERPEASLLSLQFS
jgi:hypothetical protein